jgi:putative membrane protein
MTHSSRLQIAFKGILLIALGLFLYSCIANGSLYFYINERFLGYTLFAVVALLAVGVNYQFLLQRQSRLQATQHDHDSHDHTHSHDHDHGHDHADHNHEHRLTWVGALLVLTPIILGIVVTPRPLGASAMDVRQVDVTTAGIGSLPAAVRAAQEKAAGERTVLEWNQTFQTTQDAHMVLAGEPVDVIGFVYRDERFGADQFFVTRFVVSCCAADAAVSGMVVEWPAGAALETDAWVRVTGTLAAGQLGDTTLPVVRAQSVDPVDPPQQPYLYP